MKSVAPATLDTITNGYVNEVAVVVHAEWKHNRYYRTIVDNTPSEDTDGYDIEMFPIESVTKNNRPQSGIQKAVVGQARVEPTVHDTVPASRFYLASTADTYKYWQSPEPAATVSPYFINHCAPQVTYVTENNSNPVMIMSNKVFFTVERTWSVPLLYDVQAKQTAASSWTTIASNITIPADGRVELWFNGTAWTTTKDLDHTTTITAVRLVINSMDKAGAYFNLIELGAGLELDLSHDVSAISANNSMGEPDFITPLGNISSNTGSITFANDTGKYTNENPASVLYGLLDKNVKFKCWYAYGTDLVRDFEMYADSWREEIDQTTVTLSDNSKFLQEAKPPVVLYQRVPVQEAVWRICDTIGFTDYVVDTVSTAPHTIIDIFWTNGEKTAWETFNELARATQTAIYFDSYGKLRIKVREAAWDDTRPVDFTFRRDTVPGLPPANIVSLNDNSAYEANKVTVTYKPTNFSEQVDNIIPFEVVWEPDSDVVLRASRLALSLTATDTIITLGQKDGATWPFKGIMNIEGEWIGYEGKEYSYYDKNGVRQKAWLKELSAQQRLDAATLPPQRHLNQYTGRLQVTERGLYNTEPKPHFIGLSGWSMTRQRNYSTNVTPCSGIAINNGESTVTIMSPKNSDMKDYTYLYRGAPTDDGYWYLGTRLKVDKTSHKDKVGGIFFNGDGVFGSGYFLEVTATAKFNGKRRATGNEIMFYSMKGDGTKRVFGGEKVKMKDKSKNHKKRAKIKHDIGSEKAVPMDTWVDIDIHFSVMPNNDHSIDIFVNGSLLFTAVVPQGSGWQHNRVGRFGLYARGHSSLTFEHVYAINNKGVEPPDSQPYFDRILGDYYSTQVGDWTYDTRAARRKVRKKWVKYTQKYNQRFFDDFGAWCHEIREFEVKYTPELPSLQSKLYFSNTTQAVATEFWTTPKAGHFVLANISRQNAVVSGEDELTTQGEGTINQKLFVYGRPVIQKDAQTIEKTDDWALRRRGPIDIEYSSDWIQNEDAADRFADWLTTHWSRSDSSLEVEVFGNPLIELTDVVHVTYDDIDDDYYVVAAGNSFDQGVITNLTLRKVTR